MEINSKIRITAGFYARSVNAILSNPETSHEQRERTIGEIRRLAQFAADLDMMNFVKTHELKDGEE